MVVKKVASIISENNLISAGNNITVALSGGRDSVALLYILNQLKKQFKFTMIALHVNHGIRGNESDRDQEFVKQLCEKFGIECAFYKLSGFSKTSGEDVLRKARYEIFDNYIEQNKNSKIATGHHLNDQIETFLMRLFKGSGSKGLLGIPLQRGQYIRPLLSISRDEIDSFCKINTIDFCNDSTNLEMVYLRNKIQLKIIPQIEDIFGKGFTEQFLKSHTGYKQLYDENKKWNHELFEKVVHKNKERLSVHIKDFIAFSNLQKVQYLEYCFSYVYRLDFKIRKEQISEFENFVNCSRTGTKFHFINSIEVLKDRDEIIFYPVFKIKQEIKKLYPGKSIKFDEHKLFLRKVDRKSVNFITNPLIENICGDRLQLPLTVRNWEEGDSFYPLGSNRRQKLSDFFINEKVARIKKKEIPIILNGEEVVWIAGYRLDNRYRITDKCDKFYNLEISNDNITG